jgi:HK97 gp10 family phage protein
MRITVDKTELGKLLKRMNIAPKEVFKAVGEASKKAIKPLVAAAKQEAPVETGTLRAAISKRHWVKRSKGLVGDIAGVKVAYSRMVYKTKRGKLRRASKRVVAAGGASAKRIPSKYVHLVEKGTRRSKAQPFLKPAFEQHAKGLEAAIETETQKALARVCRD